MIIQTKYFEIPFDITKYNDEFYYKYYKNFMFDKYKGYSFEIKISTDSNILIMKFLVMEVHNPKSMFKKYLNVKYENTEEFKLSIIEFFDNTFEEFLEKYYEKQ